MRALPRIITLVVVAAIATAPIAEAGKRKPKKVTRTESYEYLGTGGVEGPLGVSACIQDTGCLTLAPLDSERYLSLEAQDAIGMSAPFTVSVGFGEAEVHCGSADEIPLDDADEVTINMLAFSATCVSAGGSGTLTATFSNLP